MTNFLTCMKLYRRTSTALHRFIFTESSLRKSHYETLDIPSSASQKEIRDAYIEKSKLCHPDNDPSDPALHQKFLAVQQAYDALSSEVKRQEYDVRRSWDATTSSNRGPHHRPSSTQQPHRTRDAFWTDPEYERRERVKKRDSVGRRTRHFILFSVLLGTAFSFTCIYVIVRYKQYERLFIQEKEKYIQERARVLVNQMDVTDKSRKND